MFADIDAVMTVIGNGWLDCDDRETVGDIHDDAHERDGWLDAWENDRGPDRLGDDEYADCLGRRLCVEMGGC